MPRFGTRLRLVLVAAALVGACADGWDVADEWDNELDGNAAVSGSGRQAPARAGAKKAVAPVGGGARDGKAAGAGWDEEEFEGFPEDAETVVDGHAPTRRRSVPKAAPKGSGRGAIGYIPEAIGGALLLLYAVNYLLGARANEALVKAFATEYCLDGGFFASQFAMVGCNTGDDGDGLISRESPSEFKFYASGRRFCEGLLATITNKPRQDLAKMAWAYVAQPNLTDTLEVEVYQNEDAMEPMCLCVARAKEAKRMHRETKDLKAFASEISAASERVRKSFPKALTIIAESSALADEILSDHLMERIFSVKNGAWDAVGPYFKSMHISDAHPDSSHKRCLKFVFNLPAARDMKRLAPLVEAVTHLTDVVAKVSLPLAEKTKAKDRRARQEEMDYKEARKEREEQLAKKREAKRAGELAREESMTPEARAKLEEARRRKELQKGLRKGIKVVKR